MVTVNPLLTIEVGIGLRILERAVAAFIVEPEKYGQDPGSKWIVFQVIELRGGGFAAMLRQLPFDAIES